LAAEHAFATVEGAHIAATPQAPSQLKCGPLAGQHVSMLGNPLTGEQEWLRGRHVEA
jgi:hypothetical protein